LPKVGRRPEKDKHYRRTRQVKQAYRSVSAFVSLEGIVAKRKTSAYRPTEKLSPYWIKVKNPKYSQAEGREELFNPKPDPPEALNLAK
jgi:ATP-dependent DNA ligase